MLISTASMVLIGFRRFCGRATHRLAGKRYLNIPNEADLRICVCLRAAFMIGEILVMEFIIMLQSATQSNKNACIIIARCGRLFTSSSITRYMYSTFVAWVS